MTKNKLLVLISYLTIYLVWGSTYFFIKMAVETIPPFYVIGFRWLVGGVLILGFSFLTGRFKRLPTLREIGSAAFLGTLLLLTGNGLISVAERKVDSYMAALVLALTPIVIAFFDWALFRKRLSLTNLAGILVGVAGVALLLYDGTSITTSLSLDVLLVIFGLCSWSLATSLGHKIVVYPDILINSGIQMLMVGAGCLLGMFFYRPSLGELMPQFSVSSWTGVWYLAIVGSLAFCAYTYLVANEPAIRISSYALVNPLIATFLGLVVGKETPAPFLYYAFPIILAGLFLMIYGEVLLGYLKSLFRRPFGRLDY
ncbi:MAG: EamA family transporter [Bacteroidota bacterium]